MYDDNNMMMLLRNIIHGLYDRIYSIYLMFLLIFKRRDDFERFQIMLLDRVAARNYYLRNGCSKGFTQYHTINYMHFCTSLSTYAGRPTVPT